MSRAMKPLGRGLSALLGDADAANDGHAQRSLPIELLEPGRYQPRRRFDEEAMTALVDSVREQGILQPLLVRRRPGAAERYEIVAGERRWRAAQAAQLHEVPAIVRDLTDRAALELALVENIQREDLTALEEAEGYKRLIEEFSYTQEALAKAVGKSRSHIANLLRLLTLPPSVQQMLTDGRLTAGHARALITAGEPERLAADIVDKGLSVRDAERLAAVAKAPPAPAPARPQPDADTLALARDLSQALGLKVEIDPRGDAGRVVIHYRTLDQLDTVIHSLTAEGRR